MRSDVQWRWTAAPLRFFGFHGSIVVFFPLLIVTGLSQWTFVALGLYAAYLAYCNHRKLSPIQMLKYLRVRFIERGQWTAF